MQLTKQQAVVVDHVLERKVTVVSAGAGTGKTHTMIATVLHILDVSKDVNIDDFILITFTNAATDEMRNRLSQNLSDRLKSALVEKNEERARFWLEQKERLSSSFIGTIHGFCSMMLKTFGYEERIPHETEVLMARRFF
jgi:ATP-dependent exoDNAse (exonuclease V) beta subunit